ncbi:hypothetical protein KXD40_005397 [Peronospora effusa]|uniref:Uncharacterized protein n=1 Tax=Peronospora effusa TaxID=542832 RepID=A0A3M6VNR1_9STRA|nr:hypothetical protein DD238_000523 [Peronospora effusa]UIZ27744.1 hypothetical protein KXD40_005397 [Peronospora effusa]
MDSSFIPPPFPFPEAWPRVFAEQQQHQERKWLTSPMMYSHVQLQTPGISESYHSFDQAIPSVVTTCSDVQQDTCINDTEDEDDAYEYGYILSNEWRERFQSSIQLEQQVKSKTKKKTKKKKLQKKKMKGQALNEETVGAFNANRSSHLQEEIQAAKTRELARKWKLQRNAQVSTSTPSPTSKTPQVEALETSLNMRFNDFCDAFQPVMKNDSVNGSAQSIPSIKRTLSGGTTGTDSHGHAGGLAIHLGVGMNNMNSIPSVLHATSNTNPPQMLRAVTSSGVYNRPSTNTSLRGGSSSLSTGTNVAATTATRNVSQSPMMQDWRMYLTIEERQAVRSKIRDAYTSRCSTYEDLLQVACAIEEELLHISAPSRLDYFKSGFEFENRVKLKKDQLQGQLAALDAKRRSSSGQQQQQGNTGSGSKTVGSSKKPRN